MTFLFLTEPVKRRSRSHPQGRKNSLQVAEQQKTQAITNLPFPPRRVRTLCLVLVSCVTHKGLAEHKGYTYRQAVYSSGLWLCSLLQCEKKKKKQGRVLAEGALTILEWKTHLLYSMNWLEGFSISRLQAEFLFSPCSVVIALVDVIPLCKARWRHTFQNTCSPWDFIQRKQQFFKLIRVISMLVSYHFVPLLCCSL